MSQLLALKRYTVMYHEGKKTNLMSAKRLVQVLKIVWKNHRQDALIKLGKPWPSRLL